MSETFEDLKKYIGMNFDGLKDAVIAMLGGQRQQVDAIYFQNDLTSLASRDNVLALLIHLGYLAYDSEWGEAYIPNAEVSDAFKLAVRDIGWGAIGEALANSDRLLAATVAGDCAVVSQALDKIHESSTSVLKYNDENSLSCAVTIAYYTARRFYEIVRELSTGKGFADLAFIPRRNANKPALLVELKYNRDADSAIRQIHEKRYEGALKDYQGNMLLVGVNYDKETKKHSCVIEEA